MTITHFELETFNQPYKPTHPGIHWLVKVNPKYLKCIRNEIILYNLVCSYFDSTLFNYLLLTVSNLLSYSCFFGHGICFQSLQLNFGFCL